jgi:hypothetical protein
MLNFNVRFCKIVVDIIIYIRKIIYDFFIISFYIIVYLDDTFWS